MNGKYIAVTWSVEASRELGIYQRMMDFDRDLMHTLRMCINAEARRQGVAVIDVAFAKKAISEWECGE